MNPGSTFLRPSTEPEARSRRRGRRLSTLAAAWALLMLLVVGASAASAQAPPGDPALDQTLSSDEAVVEGPAELELGHVDMGPRLVDGQWAFLIRDDTADVPVWRSLDDVVIRVSDDALLSVPDDPSYSFVGEPGTAVHVIPQTQDPDVVWLGWNTQDPEVMATIDRGATLSFLDVDGPGEVTVYLQSGTFGEPDILWQSADGEPAPLWLDVNTHTHANWVFSEPGVYLLRAEFSADLIDGRTVSDTRTLRFAVGNDTTTADARAAAASGGAEATGTTEVAAASDDAAPVDQSTSSSSSGTGLIVVAIAGALALAGAVAVVVVRGERTKRLAAEPPSRSPTSGPTPEGGDR